MKMPAQRRHFQWRSNGSGTRCAAGSVNGMAELSARSKERVKAALTRWRGALMGSSPTPARSRIMRPTIALLGLAAVILGGCAVQTHDRQSYHYPVRPQLHPVVIRSAPPPPVRYVAPARPALVIHQSPRPRAKVQMTPNRHLRSVAPPTLKPPRHARHAQRSGPPVRQGAHPGPKPPRQQARQPARFADRSALLQHARPAPRATGHSGPARAHDRNQHPDTRRR